MRSVLADDTQLYKQFSDNEGFRQWMTEMVFTETYDPEAGGEQIELARG